MSKLSEKQTGRKCKSTASFTICPFGTSCHKGYIECQLYNIPVQDLDNTGYDTIELPNKTQSVRSSDMP